MIDSTETTEKKKRPGFTTWIVIGVVMGVLAGLFFGEYTSSIKWLGDVFVGLLQMAILPYVALSLIANIGRMSLAQGVRLLRITVVVLLGLWLIGLVALLIMSQSFPHWESGSFFGSRFTEQPDPPDWLDLFIPANPFRSLANNSVPAVVVFSIGIGIALMNIPGKERLLEPLDVMVDALGRLNKLVVNLTPIGMFAIVAHAAGTIDLAQFSLVQGYLLTYGAAAIVLAFVVLPALVAALTPLAFRDVVRASREPLIAAFVIGNSFVVLPMIIEAIRRLQVKNGIEIEDENAPEYLVPLAYPFPDIGRIVGLVFIPFAAWFYGTTIDFEQIPALLGVGLIGSFGKPVITIPLLLDLAELPNDIFSLWLASGVVAARFGDLMKTMHLMAFTMLVGAMIHSRLQVNWFRFAISAAASVLLLIVAAMSIRGYLDASFQDTYSREQLITTRELITFPRNRGLDAVTAEVIPPLTEDGQPTVTMPNPTPREPGQTRIQRIRQSGQIRIGYDPDRMPFSYFNSADKLIGFDIEMAHYLADDLGVDLVFVPIAPRTGTVSMESDPMEQASIHQQLRDDHFDVAMGALEGTVRQAALLPATQPYMNVTIAVVVPDHEKRNFASIEQIRAIPNLKLAVIKRSFSAERAPQVLTETTFVPLQSASEYFDGVHEEVDGLIISAEIGSAWTIRRPEFAVANPLKGEVQIPLYYLTADDFEFEGFLQNWLTLKRAEGTWQELYDYWILGQDDEFKPPRWCILRDVLGWK